MPVIIDFSRRNFIRYAAAVPLLSQIAARNVFASAAAALENLVTKMCIPAWA